MTQASNKSKMSSFGHSHKLASETVLIAVDSIKHAASTLVYNMLKTYYVGNVTTSQLGLLPQPYYWWESGTDS